MPFLAHFGLKEHPFTLMPNTEYFFPAHQYASIMASLKGALERETGIIKVVGEIGTGKTLLCRMLLRSLIESEVVAYVNAPQADERMIVRTVLAEFGLTMRPGTNPYGTLSNFLIEQHALGRRVVLVVDEAQALGRAGLEAIRLLSNLESERSKLLQIVLFGQTELDDLLADPALRQLNQRIAFSFSTQPLTRAETRRYIEHRLQISRRPGVQFRVFDTKALDLIAHASRGTPRVINILADKALLAAFSAGSPQVRAEHAEEAVADSPTLVRRLPLFRRALGRRLLWGVIALELVAAAAVVLWLAGLMPGVASERASLHTPSLLSWLGKARPPDPDIAAGGP